jgi:hypothetical protein
MTLNRPSPAIGEHLGLDVASQFLDKWFDFIVVNDEIVVKGRVETEESAAIKWDHRPGRSQDKLRQKPDYS